MVVYDTLSGQLVLRDASSGTKVELAECPYCHRPLRETSPENGRSRHHRSTSPGVAAGFISPEYFRMLHQSLGTSAPPSPRRRLAQPFRSSDDTPVTSPRNAGGVESSPAPQPSPQGISSTAFSPNYFSKFFIEEKELGRGGKGVVLLVRHMLDGVTLGHFACKRVPVGDDHAWLEKVLIEVQLLQYLSHQHLVSYRHVWLEEVKISNFGPSVPCAFILQQYCNAGDLLKYICRSADSPSISGNHKERIRRRSKHEIEPPRDLYGSRKLHFEEIHLFFKDITSGLNHLHANGYIHRDLKPSNCLLHDTGQGLRVLVSDFGEVQLENMIRKSSGATGTISYCAPEVLRREQVSGAYANFTTKSDIFSLGMILYFLCFAKLPYINADSLNEENEDLEQLRDEITGWGGIHDERNLRPDLPEKLYTFLRRLLSLVPEMRPSTEDILIGIKTGSGVDENSGPRPTSPRHPFESPEASSRISPLDPTPTPVPRHGTTTGFVRPGGPPKLRLSSFDKGGNRDSNASPEHGKQPPTSPGGTLVVRPSYPSPMKPREVPQLPAPPSSRNNTWLHPNRAAKQRTVKVLLLTLKVISVSMLCNPVAANPRTAYPLLGLAALDVWLIDSGIGLSIILMTLHLAWLFGSLKLELLCARRNVWEI